MLPQSLGMIEMSSQTQHIFHHNDNSGPKIHVSAEKMSKGYNWKASVEGAASVEEALALVEKAEKGLRTLYGEKVSEDKKAGE